MTGTRPQVSIVELSPTPSSVGEARRHVRCLLGDGTAEATRSTVDAEIVASELVTNAVVHACGPIRLRVTVSRRRARIEVFDGDDQAARVLFAKLGAGDHSGRGLGLVDALSDRWGVRSYDHGKSVWAEVPVPEEMP